MVIAKVGATLIFAEHRFCGEGPGATWTQEFGNGHKQVNGEDQQFAHERTLLWRPPVAKLPRTGGFRHTMNSPPHTQLANIISTNDSAEDAEFMLIAYRKSRPSFWTLSASLGKRRALDRLVEIRGRAGDRDGAAKLREFFAHAPAPEIRERDKLPVGFNLDPGKDEQREIQIRVAGTGHMASAAVSADAFTVIVWIPPQPTKRIVRDCPRCVRRSARPSCALRS